MKKVIFFLKKYHVLPVYRKDLLEYVKNHYRNYNGICEGLEDAANRVFHISNYMDSFYLVPEHRRRNALKFGVDPSSDPYKHWWPSRDWQSGRLEYLDWLIESVENDRTNLVQNER